MRISDWSSDVCSSDLGDSGVLHSGAVFRFTHALHGGRHLALLDHSSVGRGLFRVFRDHRGRDAVLQTRDRKSVVWGKGVSVRVDLGGSRILKKKKNRQARKPNSRHTHTNKTHS